MPFVFTGGTGTGTGTFTGVVRDSLGLESTIGTGTREWSKRNVRFGGGVRGGRGWGKRRVEECRLIRQVTNQDRQTNRQTN